MLRAVYAFGRKINDLVSYRRVSCAYGIRTLRGCTGACASHNGGAGETPEPSGAGKSSGTYAIGARTCRAEVRPDCLSGTLVLPRKGKDGVRAAYGLLVTQNRIVLTDDSASLPPLLHRIAQEKRWTKGTVGQTLYDFFEQLIARDLHRLEELQKVFSLNKKEHISCSL